MDSAVGRAYRPFGKVTPGSERPVVSRDLLLRPGPVEGGKVAKRVLCERAGERVTAGRRLAALAQDDAFDRERVAMIRVDAQGVLRCRQGFQMILPGQMHQRQQSRRIGTERSPGRVRRWRLAEQVAGEDRTGGRRGTTEIFERMLSSSSSQRE